MMGSGGGLMRTGGGQGSLGVRRVMSTIIARIRVGIGRGSLRE